MTGGQQTRGVILSAPGSGGGKTTITLGLLRALARKGIRVHSAKSGPDYIDPRFHEAASSQPCMNLDAWAMQPERVLSLAQDKGTLIVEGAMGLFDGAPPDGRGATADLARILRLPVILVADVSRQSQSVAAVVEGFSRHASDVTVQGVILNKVGSPRHETMLRRALEPVGLPVLGAVYRDPGLTHPSRHLGLVQARERADLESFLDHAADVMEAALDIDAILALCVTAQPPDGSLKTLPPPAQKLAIAADAAFAFAYPHLLEAWRNQGAEISFFSPLADQEPAPSDMVILPGGYPELHAGTLAQATTFRTALQNAAAVYGECGGYMTMGEGLVDASGVRHQMLGLLPLETSFAARKLHLGYRTLTPLGGPWPMALNAHEFHYATTLSAKGPALFVARDAENTDLGQTGLRNGTHCGSFAHVIDQAG